MSHSQSSADSQPPPQAFRCLVTNGKMIFPPPVKVEMSLEEYVNDLREEFTNKARNPLKSHTYIPEDDADFELWKVKHYIYIPKIWEAD